MLHLHAAIHCRVFPIVFSATSYHNRHADPIFTQLPPLYPILTTYEISCPSAIAHADSIPTTVCDSPRGDDVIETALSQMSIILASLPAAFASLFSALRSSDTLQGKVQIPNDFAVRDAIPQHVPIPTQTSLLMPAFPVDGVDANAPGNRLAQPSPTTAPATTNPPAPVRLEWDPDDRDLLLKSASRFQFTEVFGVII